MILRSRKDQTDTENIIDFGIQNRNVKRKERKHTSAIEMKATNVNESQMDQSLEIVDFINKSSIATMSSPIQCSTVNSMFSGSSIIDLSSEDIVIIPHNDTHPDVEVLNTECSSHPMNMAKKKKRKRGDQNMSVDNNEVIDVDNNIGLSVKKKVSGVGPLLSKINIAGVTKRKELNTFKTKLNDSVEILHEFNRVDVGPSDKKKQRMTEDIEIEISNQSIINLCDDEDDMIVDRKFIPLGDSKKPNVGVSNDIIPLDNSVQLMVTTARTTCTVPNRRATSAVTKQTLPKFEKVSNSVARYEPYVYNPPVHNSSYSYMVPYYFVDTLGATSHPEKDIWSAPPKNNTTSSHNKQSTEVPASNNVYGSNIYNPNPQNAQTGLRPVIIDGSNVAFSHSIGNKVFSSRGLEICVNYFLKRGHKVVAFVPQFRKSSPHVMDRSILEELEKNGLLVFTPSRRVEGHLQVPYDDRYIVQYAAEMGGVIVSTDNYRDLLQENESWRDTIQNRLLMFTWVGDLLMFPQDPLGRYGPKLEEFLCFPS